MKGMINIQIEDNECYRWHLLGQLNTVSKNITIIKIINKISKTTYF